MLNRIREELMNDAFRDRIAEDIRKAYKGRGVSLRTYAYCYGGEIPGVKPDALVKLLEHDGIGLLNISELPGLDLIKDTVDEAQKEIRNKALRLEGWEQLNSLLEYAVRSGVLEVNPVKKYVSSLRSDSKIQRSSRKALTKTTFTHEEEQRLIAFLRDKLNPDRITAESGEYLLCALRFYTGMEVRHILPLLLADSR